MILIFEQDTRTSIGGNTHFYYLKDSYNFIWKPSISKKEWEKGRNTWTIRWGIWSLSYFPEKYLDGFFDTIKEKNIRRYYGRVY